MRGAMPAPRVVLALALATALGCARAPREGEAPDPTVRRLSIATGGTSGVYYVYGGALARVLTRDLPGVEATAEVTAASVENLAFVADGSADLAFTLADTAYDAARGRGRFREPQPVRALAVLYRSVTHVVARTPGPATLGELRGRRVSTGAPNSGTELIADRVLRAEGLDPDRDLRRERLGINESVAALKDGKVEAFFWSGGVPTAGVLELAATPRLRIHLLSDAHLVDRLVAAHGPLYATATIPAGVYPGVAAVTVSSALNLLVAHRDLPAEVAYGVTRLLFARRDELAAAHPAARELDPRTGAESVVMEYHPGAARYYEEKGVWKARPRRP
jgi:TRAP transporter TAXI family solute receptor